MIKRLRKWLIKRIIESMFTNLRKNKFKEKIFNGFNTFANDNKLDLGIYKKLNNVEKVQLYKVKFKAYDIVIDKLESMIMEELN